MKVIFCLSSLDAYINLPKNICLYYICKYLPVYKYTYLLAVSC